MPRDRVQLRDRKGGGARAFAATQRGRNALSQTTARTRNSLGGRKTKIQGLHGRQRLAQRCQLSRAQNRPQQELPVPQGHLQRHHVGFAQRINRRIRHLREPLLAVIPKRPRQRGKKSRRRVIAHAPIGFLARQQRPEQYFVLVLAPSRSAGDTLGLGHSYARGPRFQLQQARVAHRSARHLRRHPLQQFSPPQQHPGLRIRQDHLARSEAVALRHARFFQVHQARLRAGDHQSVVRHRITHGPQPVAIQLHADRNSIAEDHRRRAIPRRAFVRQRLQRRPHFRRKKRIVHESGRHQREHRRFHALPLQ